MPRCTGQVPIYYNCPPSGRDVNGYYGTGNINYHDCDGTPMYRFGYGLSYSKFDISFTKTNYLNINLSELRSGKKINLSSAVKNVSDIGGYEVVQLYIRDTVASMTRPIRELKAYKKLYVNPYETVYFDFEIGYKELGFYNSQGEFVVEPGKFEIYVGNDCYAKNKVEIQVI